MDIGTFRKTCYIITRCKSHNGDDGECVCMCVLWRGRPQGNLSPVSPAGSLTMNRVGVQPIHSGWDVEVSRASEQPAAHSSSWKIPVCFAFVLQKRCSGFRIALQRRILRVTSRCANPFFGWLVSRCVNVRTATTAFIWTVAYDSLLLCSKLGWKRCPA